MAHISSTQLMATLVRAGEPACSQNGIRDQSNQSTRWAGSARLGPKWDLSIAHSILIHLRPHLAGSHTLGVVYRAIFLFYFISQIYIFTLFEQANRGYLFWIFFLWTWPGLFYPRTLSFFVRLKVLTSPLLCYTQSLSPSHKAEKT